MFHQYGTQRHRGGHNPHGRGVLAVGQIVYLQDRLPRYGALICRNPWIVESFANREYHPARAGAPPTTYCHGGYLITVRSLRDGCRQAVADHIVQCAVDCDLEWCGQRSNRSRSRREAATAAAQGDTGSRAAQERAAV